VSLLPVGLPIFFRQTLREGSRCCVSFDHVRTLQMSRTAFSLMPQSLETTVGISGCACEEISQPLLLCTVWCAALIGTHQIYSRMLHRGDETLAQGRQHPPLPRFVQLFTFGMRIWVSPKTSEIACLESSTLVPILEQIWSSRLAAIPDFFIAAHMLRPATVN
jgi:hypothetical protein